MIARRYDEIDFDNLTYNDLYDWIAGEFNIATWQEVEEYSSKYGATVKTLNKLIYDKTGYEDLEAYVKYEDPI